MSRVRKPIVAIHSARRTPGKQPLSPPDAPHRSDRRDRPSGGPSPAQNPEGRGPNKLHKVSEARETEKIAPLRERAEAERKGSFERTGKPSEPVQQALQPLRFAHQAETLVGRPGPDNLVGFAGGTGASARLDGQAGGDVLLGGSSRSGEVEIHGGADNDVVYGMSLGTGGQLNLSGGEGDDRFVVDERSRNGRFNLRGGAGSCDRAMISKRSAQGAEGDWSPVGPAVPGRVPVIGGGVDIRAVDSSGQVRLADGRGNQINALGIEKFSFGGQEYTVEELRGAALADHVSLTNGIGLFRVQDGSVRDRLDGDNQFLAARDGQVFLRGEPTELVSDGTDLFVVKDLTDGGDPEVAGSSITAEELAKRARGQAAPPLNNPRLDILGDALGAAVQRGFSFVPGVGLPLGILASAGVNALTRASDGAFSTEDALEVGVNSLDFGSFGQVQRFVRSGAIIEQLVGELIGTDPVDNDDDGNDNDDVREPPEPGIF